MCDKTIISNFKTTTCAIPPGSWTKTISKYIRSIDQNHLIMAGSDWCMSGDGSCFCPWEFDSIDIISEHCYEEECPANFEIF
jgi:hypothetical protein